MSSIPIMHKNDTWKIWFETFVNGEKRGAGVWIQEYKHKSSAVRMAKKHFNPPRTTHDGQTLTYKWIVSQTNPFRKE